MRKNKLLLLLLIPPPYGGGEILGLYMADYFRGHSGVRTLTFSRKWASKYTQGRITVRNIFYGLYYIVRSVGYMIVDRPQKMFFSIPKNISAFARMIPLIYLAQLLRIKVYGELAGANFLFMEEGGWRKKIGLHFLQKLQSIHFLGTSVAKYHEQYGLKNPAVFPNGIEHPCLKTNISRLPDSARLELLYVGELSRSKGVERIVHALRHCRKDGLNVFCTIIGEWRDPLFERETQTFIRENGLDSMIAFTGLLKGGEKWAFYDKAHVLKHPTDLDGQPVTILEAMGSGLAIISTRIGAIPDTIEDGVNGFILPEISGEALYEAVRKLYFDRDLLHRMRVQNVQTFIERYKAEVYLKNVDQWLSGATLSEKTSEQGTDLLGTQNVLPAGTHKVKKRLLLLLLLPPPFGGGEMRGLRMSEYYRDRGDVRMLTFSRPWANKFTQGRVTLRNILYGLYYITRSAAYMIVDRPQKMFFSIPKNISAFMRMVPLIHLAQFLGIKVCGELAGANFIFIEEGGWGKTFGLHFLRKMHSIRFLGRSIAKYHEQYGFKNTITFANGLKLPDTAPVISRLPDSARLELLYVGELSRSKGVKRIVEVLLRCREEGLDVFCTLLGEWKDPAFEAEVQSLIRQTGLTEMIAFPGLMSSDQKWLFYSQAHVLTHITDMDGQPMSILEAMSSGLAIVSTHIGAIPDTIEDGVNGVILPEISGEAAYDAIRKLYFDRDILHRMRIQNAKTSRELYSMESYLGNVDRWLS